MQNSLRAKQNLWIFLPRQADRTDRTDCVLLLPGDSRLGLLLFWWN
jgi:hypothetical protein